jgi:heme/copper-type cytochrome/quinol oxidase subunit 3
MRAVGAPVNRILWSVQAGVVLAAGGLGLWFAKASVIEEAAQALNVVAVLAVALGVGFVASALVAYALSRQLGLLESEPRSTHA